ncbi:MAG TPA: TIGR00153 family protein [Phycisphaerales bacterium]|nr:TIGR00153 family protein [Phycisphaerales bacterium]HCD32077.1 TIGR00153 family protein [Phycisphaerales bacterium]|tara:strand:+ start:1221 stop:1895 length:675 start_codon:yes stop_codon:yes gene_type:complete
MRTIASLFGRSPFGPIQAHMNKVASCIDLTQQVTDAYLAGRFDEVQELRPRISDAEYKADLVRDDIRNHLPKSLFMPIDRRDLLELLITQDRIAGCCERTGHLLSLVSFTIPQVLADELKKYVQINFEAYKLSHQIVEQIDELIEYAFSGSEAEKVKDLVEQVARKEYEASKFGWKFLGLIYQEEASLKKSEFNLLQRLIEELGMVSKLSELVANQIRMTLERK